MATKASSAWSGRSAKTARPLDASAAIWADTGLQEPAQLSGNTGLIGGYGEPGVLLP